MRASCLLLLLCACGPIGEDDICECGDASFPSDAGSEVGFADVQDEAPTPPFNGGGDFLCNGCICDGTQRYCFNEAINMHAPILDAGITDASDADAIDADVSDSPFGDAGSCDMDANAVEGCTAIPLECLPQPTCACLLQQNSGQTCVCNVDETGNGFVMTCD